MQEDKRLRPASISLVVLDEADKLFEPPMDEQVMYVVVVVIVCIFDTH